MRLLALAVLLANVVMVGVIVRSVREEIAYCWRNDRKELRRWALMILVPAASAFMIGWML